jgi:hypothetical protein
LTLTELLLVSAALGFLLLPTIKFMHGSGRFLSNLFSKANASNQTTPLDVLLDRELPEMVELTVAKQNEIQFILDSTRLPGYDPSGDQDGDGVPNEWDPDRDGDQFNWVNSADWRFVGNDLDDDDDDGDGQVDVQCRYVLEGQTLYRDIRFNEGSWRRSVLGQGFVSCQFTFSGSATGGVGFAADFGLDGIPNNGDPGDRDGIVTWEELDAALPPVGPGNANGILDGKELRSIASIGVSISIDGNGDGIPDKTVSREISPPLLAARRYAL